MFTDLFFRLRSLFRAKTVDAELNDELSFHLERQLQKYVDSGLTRDEAQRRVRIEFGGLHQVQEECREARGTYFVETLFRDVRYALRTLRQTPGFLTIAILTLALGIGATTAIFSVVYGVLLHPLPYKDPPRLIVMNETTPRVGVVSVSYPNFLDWRAQSRTFSEMAAVQSVDFNLAGVDQPENISGEAVSTNFLSILGVRPILGRDFAASEEKAGTAPVVLLSHSLWQSHFGGDRNVLGRTISLNGRAFSIVGVLPANFISTDKVDVMEPIGVWATDNPSVGEREARGDSVVVARLAPGVSFEQARTEMQGIAARLAQAYPAANDQFSVALKPIRDIFVGEIRPALLVLFTAVVFVMLIACANVANLFLMRGAGRTKEIALRMAIGASRGRIVGQMLVESFILALFGGVLGLGIAAAGIRGVVLLLPKDTMANSDLRLNGIVLLFTAGVVVLSAFVFGLSPALESTKADVQTELRESGRTASGSKAQNRWRSVLVVAEVSLALILLVGAGLMMQSLFRLLSVDPGFRPDRVLTMQMSLRTAQYGKNAPVLNFWQQVLDRVHALPGVEAAALATVVPLTEEHNRTDITVEGMALPTPGNFPHPDYHVISPEYLSAMGVPLLRGRTFSEADNENAPLVAMINGTLAQRFFPNQNPVGKRFSFGHPSPSRPPKWVTIVGTVADTKLYGLSNPARLEVYVPFRQVVTGEMSLIVKSGSDPAALTSAIRSAIASIDKDQPIFGISTMRQLVRNSVSTQRVTLILLCLFSALALVLAAIGVYGVISYSVAQRTHEIGIRMALGAHQSDVLRMVLAQGAKIAGAGIVIGAAASLGLMRLMSKLLFSVSATDPATFLAVALVLAATALLACYIPARRTVRIDPMIALRHE
jgi:putative ABC transport system permease protein